MLDPGTDVLFSVSGPISGKKNPAAVNICIVYRYIVTIYRYKIFSWDIINCYRILLQNILRDIVVWYRCVIYILLVDIVWDILMKYWLLKISFWDIVTRYLLLSAGCQDLLQEDYSHCGWLRKQSFINRVGKFRCKCNIHFNRYLIKVTLHLCYTRVCHVMY